MSEPALRDMQLFSLVESLAKADTAYPRGSEAQVRMIEELAQDARYVLYLFKPAAKLEIREIMNANLGGFTLMRGKLKEGQCAECAVIHETNMPHNQQSLFWQYSFMEKNGRWPKWADAMAHCTPEMKAEWTRLLAEHGVTV